LHLVYWVNAPTGEYEFLVPQGIYVLTVTADGYHEYRSAAFEAQEGQVIADVVQLQPLHQPIPAWVLIGIGALGALLVGAGLVWIMLSRGRKRSGDSW